MLVSTSPQHDLFSQDTAKLKHKHGIAIGHQQPGATVSTNDHAGTKSKKLKTYFKSLDTLLHEFPLILNPFIKEITPSLLITDFLYCWDLNILSARDVSVAVRNTVIGDILSIIFLPPGTYGFVKGTPMPRPGPYLFFHLDRKRQRNMQMFQG